MIAQRGHFGWTIFFPSGKIVWACKAVCCSPGSKSHDTPWDGKYPTLPSHVGFFFIKKAGKRTLNFQLDGF